MQTYFPLELAIFSFKEIEWWRKGKFMKILVKILGFFQSQLNFFFKKAVIFYLELCLPCLV